MKPEEGVAIFCIGSLDMRSESRYSEVMSTATATTPATTPATFEIGATYQAVSACDSNCIWTLEVIARTAKFVTLRDIHTGDTNRVGVRNYNGEEWASPFGTYSMAPVIRANR